MNKNNTSLAKIVFDRQLHHTVHQVFQLAADQEKSRRRTLHHQPS